MKRRINFQKLVNGEYDLSTELHMINWLLDTGKGYEEYSGRWTKYGVSKFLLGYSANNYDGTDKVFWKPVHTDNVKYWISSILLNAFVKTTTIECINEWRKNNNIYLDKIRVLEISDEIPPYAQNYSLFWEIKNLYDDFAGKDLNSDFDILIKSFKNGRINNLTLSVNGYGYAILCDLSYGSESHNFSYYNSRLEFLQKRDESIDMFIYRVKNKLYSYLKTNDNEDKEL